MYERRVLCEDFRACKNVLLLPLGMDVSEVKRVKREPVEPRRILYIGALKPYKNVDRILEGFAQFMNRGNKQFRLVIVGQGPQYGFLIDLANRLGIAPFVEWKRGLTRQRLLLEYARSSVFVLLSQLESFSLVVYEALMIGVPVVLLNLGALAGLVDAGLAEGVAALGANEIADAFTKATNKHYVRISEGMKLFLDWKEYSNRIMSIYQNLLEQA
jgi:glycosyltransferase involved in cell wall biosynthesis